MENIGHDLYCKLSVVIDLKRRVVLAKTRII